GFFMGAFILARDILLMSLSSTVSPQHNAQESSRLCLRQPYSADRFARHCAVGKGATNSHLSGRKVLCTSSQATAPAMPVTTTFLGEPWRESVAVRASDLAARVQVHPISKSLPRSHGGMTTSLRGGPSRHGSRPS